MNKNKYANYGKVSTGDDVFGYGIERYYDNLRDAEESRRAANLPNSSSTKSNQSPLKIFWHMLTQIF